MTNARILVVDDEPQIRRFLKTTLEVRGYEVALAETGREALEQVTGWRPDVVLLDLGLPIMNGLEVCRRVREWSDVPIIVLTVRDREEDKVLALNTGADDYLTKGRRKSLASACNASIASVIARCCGVLMASPTSICAARVLARARVGSYVLAGQYVR